MKLEDRTVWVTGASAGIGRALALEAARRGARVVLTARREPQLREVEASARQLCPKDHSVLALDLERTDTLGEQTAALLEAQGPMDVFIHAAGLTQRGSTVETELSVHQRLMALNYFSAVAITKALLPSMFERGRGHLVGISSVSGKIGVPHRSAYCASKHALHGFFESVRAEGHHRGLRVTMVCPGYVATQLSLNALSPDGSPHGASDASNAAGLSAEACARRTIDGIERDEEEIVVGGKETWVVPIRRISPSLAHRLVRRFQKDHIIAREKHS